MLINHSELKSYSIKMEKSASIIVRADIGKDLEQFFSLCPLGSTLPTNNSSGFFGGFGENAKQNKINLGHLIDYSRNGRGEQEPDTACPSSRSKCGPQVSIALLQIFRGPQLTHFCAGTVGYSRM
jgi:hypothetical protein